jgi:outer membrane lipoprotein SlyB
MAHIHAMNRVGTIDWYDREDKADRARQNYARRVYTHEVDFAADKNCCLVTSCTVGGAAIGGLCGLLPGAAIGGSAGFVIGVSAAAIAKSIEENRCVLF